MKDCVYSGKEERPGSMGMVSAWVCNHPSRGAFEKIMYEEQKGHTYNFDGCCSIAKWITCPLNCETLDELRERCRDITGLQEEYWRVSAELKEKEEKERFERAVSMLAGAKDKGDERCTE